MVGKALEIGEQSDKLTIPRLNPEDCARINRTAEPFGYLNHPDVEYRCLIVQDRTLFRACGRSSDCYRHEPHVAGFVQSNLGGYRMEETKGYGGHSMTGELRRVILCPPRVAGWEDAERAERWKELGYFHPPDVGLAEAQHQQVVEALERAGGEVVALTDGDGLSLDAVYAHDASFMTDYGPILMRMGKPGRVGEPAQHGALYRNLGIPILGKIEPPGTAEGGDILWIDGTTLLVGQGYRTNEAAIEQIRGLLAPKGVDVIAAPLPYGPGPDACLHLMSLVSVLDERMVLVDLPWLSVSTVELFRQRGFEWIEIDASERDTMACNVLALGKKRLLALEENVKTIARLRAGGFEVTTFAGSEVSQNGSGGPTCLTRPLLRV